MDKTVIGNICSGPGWSSSIAVAIHNRQATRHVVHNQAPNAGLLCKRNAQDEANLDMSRCRSED
jgi:hypothetical protein